MTSSLMGASFIMPGKFTMQRPEPGFCFPQSSHSFHAFRLHFSVLSTNFTDITPDYLLISFPSFFFSLSLFSVVLITPSTKILLYILVTMSLDRLTSYGCYICFPFSHFILSTSKWIYTLSQSSHDVL